ncbi:MAG: ParA family protein [Myxococcota bacterium]|nr:ParA family protein [Myxococcota bacterium]
MHKITMSQLKGGVTKTATAVHLAKALAKRERRTLFIDLDRQASGSLILGVPTSQAQQACVGDCLGPKATKSLLDILVQPNKEQSLYIAPAAPRMTQIESDLYKHAQRAMFLDKILNEVEDHFHYVVIDTPPTDQTYTQAALFAAELVLAPLPYESGMLQGWQDLFNTLTELNEFRNAPAQIAGVVTKFDRRVSITNSAFEEKFQSLGMPLAETTIPKCEKINQAAIVHQSLFEYDPKHAACTAFLKLADEVIDVFEKGEEQRHVA